MVFVLRKKNIISFGIVAFLLIFAFGFFGELSAKETFFKAEGKTIIIDAGHGAYSQYYKF